MQTCRIVSRRSSSRSFPSSGFSLPFLKAEVILLEGQQWDSNGCHLCAMESFHPLELLDTSVVWLPHSHRGRSKNTLFCVCFSAYFLRRDFQKRKHHSLKLWTLSAEANMLVMLSMCLWRGAKG